LGEPTIELGADVNEIVFLSVSREGVIMSGLTEASGALVFALTAFAGEELAA
jgi:hypothetical protein